MTEYTEGESAYTSNSPFVRALRTEGRVRVLDALASNPQRPLSVSGLMRKTGMARSTVLDSLEPLDEMDIVQFAGRVSNANLYQLNSDSEAAEKLWEAKAAFTTDDDARKEAPEPESHADEDLDLLGGTFGNTPTTEISESNQIVIGPSRST